MLGAVGTSIGLATGLIGFASFLDVASQFSPRFFQAIATAFAVMLAFYTVLEGIWGASAGKALCRLRVQGPQRNPPGLARAFARAALFLLLPPLPYWIVFGFNPYRYMAQSGHLAAQGISLLYYVMLALLFCTARRRNGLAAVHDLLTGTRVVRKPVFEARPVLQVSDSAPPATDDTRKVGPYHILETLELNGDGEWLLGYDTRLLRKAWVRVVPPGTPPIPPLVRNLGRVGRLRWIAGRRSAGENWDAFEGATGSSLLSLSGQRQSWSRVRYWLLDLATEISAAQKDGTLPAVLALDRVWVTTDGRAKLLDFPGPGTRQPGAAETSAVPPALPNDATAKWFLDQVAVCALEGRTSGAASGLLSDASISSQGCRTELTVPLPIHARQFLRKLPAFRALMRSSPRSRRCCNRWRRSPAGGAWPWWPAAWPSRWWPAWALLWPRAS